MAQVDGRVLGAGANTDSVLSSSSFFSMSYPLKHPLASFYMSILWCSLQHPLASFIYEHSLALYRAPPLFPAPVPAQGGGGLQERGGFQARGGPRPPSEGQLRFLESLG